MKLIQVHYWVVSNLSLVNFNSTRVLAPNIKTSFSEGVKFGNHWYI